MKKLITILIILFLTSCDSADERYDAGYGDGYAAGYNTTCKIRATMIEGDWDNKNYSNGYNDGYTDGSYDCRNKKD